MSEQSQVIWSSPDPSGKYLARCVRDSARQGTLQLIEAKTKTVVRSQEFPLAYGAVFGPDVGDVRIWNVTASRWMEEHETKLKSQEPPDGEKQG